MTVLNGESWLGARIVQCWPVLIGLYSLFITDSECIKVPCTSQNASWYWLRKQTSAKNNRTALYPGSTKSEVPKRCMVFECINIKSCLKENINAGVLRQ